MSDPQLIDDGFFVEPEPPVEPMPAKGCAWLVLFGVCLAFWAVVVRAVAGVVG